MDISCFDENNLANNNMIIHTVLKESLQKYFWNFDYETFKIFNFGEAQPQLQLQLWLRLVLFSNSSSHPQDKQWHLPDKQWHHYPD